MTYIIYWALAGLYICVNLNNSSYEIHLENTTALPGPFII